MNKLKTFFLTDAGWLTKKGELVLFWGGASLMFGPLYLVSLGYLNFTVAFLSFSVGTAMAVATGYEGQARMFGFQPPFTEDPLGWRRAKRSYAPMPETRLPACDEAALCDEVPPHETRDTDALPGIELLGAGPRKSTSPPTIKEAQIK